MNFQEYKEIVLSDHKKNKTCQGWIIGSFIKYTAFRYVFLMRTTRFLAETKGAVSSVLYAITRLLLGSYYYRYGIEIPFQAAIGPGFSISEFGRIHVCPEAKIGRNCIINCGTFIGKTVKGKHPGAPTIKDNVYIGPYSKIIGGIEIGNNVTIGKKSVVTESVADNLIVMTMPQFLGMQDF